MIPQTRSAIWEAAAEKVLFCPVQNILAIGSGGLENISVIASHLDTTRYTYWGGDWIRSDGDTFWIPSGGGRRTCTIFLFTVWWIFFLILLFIIIIIITPTMHNQRAASSAPCELSFARSSGLSQLGDGGEGRVE